MPQSEADEAADKIMDLLDIGLKAMRAGDGDVALMAVKEGLKVAKTLPQKDGTVGVITLPDRSSEKI